LNYKSMDDWYNLTSQILRKHNAHILIVNNSILQLLSLSYPDHKWSTNKFKIVSQTNYWTKLLGKVN